jgi:hypothetical protein
VRCRDIAPLTHGEASVSALDQRRAAEQQALVGAGEAEIAVAGFVQTPNLMDHVIRLLTQDMVTKLVSKVNKKETQERVFRSTASPSE